jgi:hypothetical protein
MSPAILAYDGVPDRLEVCLGGLMVASTAADIDPNARL